MRRVPSPSGDIAKPHCSVHNYLHSDSCLCLDTASFCDHFCLHSHSYSHYRSALYLLSRTEIKGSRDFKIYSSHADSLYVLWLARVFSAAQVCSLASPFAAADVKTLMKRVCYAKPAPVNHGAFSTELLQVPCCLLLFCLCCCLLLFCLCCCLFLFCLCCCLLLFCLCCCLL